MRKLSQEFRTLAMLAIVVLPVGGIQAAENAPPGPTPESLRFDHDLEKVVIGLAGYRLSHPKRLSASFGWMFTEKPSDYDCRTLCRFRGWYLQAEPGLSGAQLSAGYAQVMGEKGRNRFLLENIYLAYGIKGSVQRTWDADLRPAEQTLVGLQGDFTVIRVNFSLGLFHSIGNNAPDDRWTVTGGIGWGF